MCRHFVAGVQGLKFRIMGRTPVARIEIPRAAHSVTVENLDELAIFFLPVVVFYIFRCFISVTHYI